VVVVGTGALRQYPYDNGPLVEGGTDIIVLTADAAEAHRSPAALAALGDPAALCTALADSVTPRGGDVSGNGSGPGGAPLHTAPATPQPPAPGEALRAGHVLAALAERLPRDAILVEETPSSRPELHRRIAIAQPGGF